MRGSSGKETIKTESEIKQMLQKELDDLAVYQKMEVEYSDETLCQGWVEALRWVIKDPSQ